MCRKEGRFFILAYTCIYSIYNALFFSLPSLILTKEIAKFRDERVKYHMQEMKEILYKYLETEKTKK